jgi:hypothetical protein
MSDEKPDWWPKNPYPEHVFTMTDEEYDRVFFDDKLRSSVSGYLGRLFWDIASEDIHKAMQYYHPEVK